MHVCVHMHMRVRKSCIERCIKMVMMYLIVADAYERASEGQGLVSPRSLGRQRVVG